jgi:uncharacterized membrane protein YbhN (UPF0104 family)
MQWLNDIQDWIGSAAGQHIITSAIIPFVAIVVAGIVGAAIGRGATRRLVAQRDHETRASAVAALVAATDKCPPPRSTPSGWPVRPT